jgi:hypothetical protein
MDVLTENARTPLQREPGRVCQQAKTDDSLNVTQIRPQRQHHDTADNYMRVVVRLGQNWRVIELEHLTYVEAQERDLIRQFVREVR